MILGVTDRAVEFVGEGIDFTLRIGELPDSTSIERPIAMATVVTCAAFEYLYGMANHRHSTTWPPIAASTSYPVRATGPCPGISR